MLKPALYINYAKIIQLKKKKKMPEDSHQFHQLVFLREQFQFSGLFQIELKQLPQGNFKR